MVDGSQYFLSLAKTKKLNQASTLNDIHTFLSELLAAFSPDSGLEKDHWVNVKLDNSLQTQQLKTVAADNITRNEADNTNEKLFYSDVASLLEGVVEWLRTGNYKSYETTIRGLNQPEITFNPGDEWGRDGDVPPNQISENSLQRHHSELRQMIEGLLNTVDQLLKEALPTFALKPLFQMIDKDPLKAWVGDEKNYSVSYFAQVFSQTPEGSRFLFQQNSDQVSILEMRKLCDYFTDKMNISLLAMQSETGLGARRKGLLKEKLDQLIEQKEQFYFGETKNILPGKPGSKKGGTDQQKIDDFLSFFSESINSIQSDSELVILIKNFADNLIKKRIKQAVLARIYKENEFDELQIKL